MMNNPGAFLDEILEFDANNIPDQALANCEDVIEKGKDFFKFEVRKTL